MRVALIYPPTADPTAPYLSVPMLTGFLRANGVEVLPIDANVEAFDSLFKPAPMKAMRDRIEHRLHRLDQKPHLSHVEQLAFATLCRVRAEAHAVPDGIAQAMDILRDEERFFDPTHYARAVDTVDAALRVISAAHAPLHLDFSGYRTPFALLSPDEITHDASPERDPFDTYIEHDLVPRLRAAKLDAIGLSVCFPGQLQPAFSFGLKIKRALPEVHLTVGGPAITQILLRLRGPDLAQALGPFDSAVVFEGEHTLLALLRELEAHPRKIPTEIPNVIHRDPFLGARYVPGPGLGDLAALPAPDFTGLPLDRYFAPRLVLPYDPTRGCYWGKCAFCHYGLTEAGTARYRERDVAQVVDHLSTLAKAHGTRHFYFSQDSVAPKTLVRLAQSLAGAELDIRWGTDLKPEKYLTPDRAHTLRTGGAVACALGVESGNQRVLSLIDKGAPVQVVGEAIEHLDDAGIAVEAMCFTGFPTETFAEAKQTLRFLEEHRPHLASFIVGQFDLTHGSRVANEPERYGLREIWQVAGDRFGMAMFFTEKRLSRRGDEPAKLEEALDRLAAGWSLRHYPWAGALSTAHSLLYYDRYDKNIFRTLAGQTRGGILGVRPFHRPTRFDPSRAADAESAEADIWATLIHEQRRVSRQAYTVLADALPPLLPRRSRPRKEVFSRMKQPGPGRRPKNR